MYSGFAEEVPVSSEQLILALDVVVPIQDALGELFCRPVAACLPARLVHIELLNQEASRARVRVSLGESAIPRELSLVLARVGGERWDVEQPAHSSLEELCAGFTADRSP
jgi:hypothetical protein